MDKDLEVRIRKAEAIFDGIARRHVANLESEGKLAPPPAATKGGFEYGGRRVAAAK